MKSIATRIRLWLLPLLIGTLGFLQTGVAPAFAQPAPAAIRGLDAAETALLDAGRPVVRAVRDPKKLALAVAGAEADALRSRIASIKPNYLTEVVATVPAADAAGASALLQRLAAALSDVDGYVGIRYYSTRQKTDYDLFDKMEIRSRAALPSGESIEVVQHMEPFDDFGARYEYRLLDSAGAAARAGEASAMAFYGSNLGPIVYSYRNFKAVTSGNMVWGLYAFRDGERVVFYGIGGVKAFDLMGIFRDRLEASFTGRMTAFFTAMSERLRGGASQSAPPAVK
jgi:hypothetical protein